MKIKRHVTDDIILEILHRLPVNTLLRFTSVSKAWKAWIESSSFISAHHQMNKKISYSHLIYMQRRDPQYCALIPESSDEVTTRISSPPPWNINACIVGSSGGLVCLRTLFDIYVWNPIIITLKRINPPGRFRGPCENLGFGFAHQRRDHRIVRLLREGGYLIGAEIYSLSSDSWARIEPPSGRLERCRIMPSDSHVSFKGSIYWLTHLRGIEGYVDMILRFDLDKERIEEIETDTNARNSICKIRVVDGFLVLLTFQIGIEQMIPIRGYIYKESESGLSSWDAIEIVDFPKGKADRVWYTTPGGLFVLERNSDRRVFVCDCYCDGKNLGFRLRDLGFNNYKSWNVELIPIKETLHLFDGGLDKNLTRWRH